MRLTGATLGKPARGLGGFFALSLEIMVQLVRPPFAWREFILQSWFVARVSIFPGMLLAITLNAFVVFLLNILLLDIGAADIAGAGAGLGAVTRRVPMRGTRSWQGSRAPRRSTSILLARHVHCRRPKSTSHLAAAELRRHSDKTSVRNKGSSTLRRERHETGGVEFGDQGARLITGQQRRRPGSTSGPFTSKRKGATIYTSNRSTN
jgi:hypothetical protein